MLDCVSYAGIGNSLPLGTPDHLVCACLYPSISFCSIFCIGLRQLVFLCPIGFACFSFFETAPASISVRTNTFLCVRSSKWTPRTVGTQIHLGPIKRNTNTESDQLVYRVPQPRSVALPIQRIRQDRGHHRTRREGGGDRKQRNLARVFRHSILGYHQPHVGCKLLRCLPEQTPGYDVNLQGESLLLDRATNQAFRLHKRRNMMVPVDPGGHPHPISAHPFGLRHIESLTPDQIYARREATHSAPPPQAMSSGAHQFHPPPHPGWIEAQPRGTQGPSMSSVAPGTSQGIPHGGGPRRSPRGTAGAMFRFELQAPPPIHTLHSRAHPSGPSTGSGHHIVQQRPSPRGCGIGVHPGALQQRSNVMRAPSSAPVPGHRRRPEHLQLVGPLGEPMFVGSPAANVGEASTGPETVSRVLIPNCKIGAVIGKGGAIIKHIREVGDEVPCSMFTLPGSIRVKNEIMKICHTCQTRL